MEIDYSKQHPVKKIKKRPIAGRFLAKIIVSETRFFEGTACWEWQASLDDSGYGRFQALNEFFAHRVAHKLFIGDIPDGLEVDHRCRNRTCQNPLHLEAVTVQINRKRRNETQRECKNGHALSGDNLYISPKGHRTCKACRYQAIAAWRERHPEKAREINRVSKASWRAKQADNG